MKLYTWFVSRLILALCRYCLRRGRYVDYVHQGRHYLRRYAVCGWLTGDNMWTGPDAATFERGAWRYRIAAWRLWRKARSCLPNLYVHQMINPDLDPCLHDHPWPWAVSWIALGGYTEHRINPAAGTDFSELKYCVAVECTERPYRAPALNVLHGTDFHRIAELGDPGHTAGGRGTLKKLGWCLSPTGYMIGCSGSCLGTWTLFLAGPRRKSKQWGYLVPGRGYVHHSERHQEFGGQELRGKPVNV